MNLFELLRLGFLLAPDDGAGGGGATPPAAVSPAAGVVEDDQAGGGDGDGGGEGDEPKHTISQTDLTKRLERARNEAVAKLLKELGVEAPDDLKSIVEGEKARREGELSAVQKLERERDALVKERDDLRVKYEALVEDVRAERVNSAISGAARHAKHPADVIVWAKANAADELAGVINDDGAVDEAKAKAVVAKCQKARPEWFNATTPGVPSNAGAQGPNTADQVKQIADLAMKQTRSFM